MTKLTDTQAIILSAAAQRPGNAALPLPAKLRGGAAQKVVQTMLAKGLLEEVAADINKDATTLVATDTGLAAIGIEPETLSAGGAAEADEPGPATEADNDPAKPEAATTEPHKAAKSGPRANSKQARMIDMMRRPEGASADEIGEALGWQRHTVRGAIAGSLRKKLALDVAAEKIEGRGTVYRIAA